MHNWTQFNKDENKDPLIDKDPKLSTEKVETVERRKKKIKQIIQLQSVLTSDV